MKTAGSSRRFRRAFALLAAAAVLFLLAVEFVVPRFFLRPLTLSTARWTSSRSLTPFRLLAGKYLQYELVAAVARRETGPSDPTAVASRLARLRRRFRPHPFGTPWPVILSGLGFCDQVNGVGAAALARQFQESQLFAIVDPRTGESPHTIGRYRNGGGEWTYFDMFYDRVVVFRARPGGPQILAAVQTPGTVADPRQLAVSQRLYTMMGEGNGFVLRRFGRFFVLDFLRDRLDDMIRGRRVKLSSVDLSSLGPPSARRIRRRLPLQPERDRKLMRLFLAARFEDLAGSPDKARAFYRSVAGSPSVAGWVSSEMLRRGI